MKHIETKKTDAGVMIIRESDTKVHYEIATKANHWRGGKIYFANKIIRILEGKAIMTWELEGKDEEVILTPEDGEFMIPAGIPHIFHFPEITDMNEEFLKETKTENFERYRAWKK